jgi:hypothetical protein
MRSFGTELVATDTVILDTLNHFLARQKEV